MTEFLKRTISGVVFVAIVLSALFFGEYSFFGVFLIFMTGCLVEFYRLIHKMNSQPQMLLGVIIGVSFFAWVFCYSIDAVEFFTIYAFVALLIALFIIEIYRGYEKPIHNIAFTIMGLVYIVAPFSLLNFIVISNDTYNPKYLLAMLLMVWGNDTGAYLTGVSIGKHKMFPRISPKKSWEGFFGGVVFTAIVAFLISLYYTEVAMHHWFILGAIASVFAVFGDLLESMFKRAVGVKDSGKFMPGHGGLLDRFDAFIMVIPVTYVFLKLMLLI